MLTILDSSRIIGLISSLIYLAVIIAIPSKVENSNYG